MSTSYFSTEQPNHYHFIYVWLILSQPATGSTFETSLVNISLKLNKHGCVRVEERKRDMQLSFLDIIKKRSSVNLIDW